MFFILNPDNFDKSNVFKDEQFSNIKFISVICEVSKFDISKEINDKQF